MSRIRRAIIVKRSVFRVKYLMKMRKEEEKRRRGDNAGRDSGRDRA